MGEDAAQDSPTFAGDILCWRMLEVREDGPGTPTGVVGSRQSRAEKITHLSRTRTLEEALPT